MKPSTAEKHSRFVLARYSYIEAELLALIARRLKAGYSAPRWAQEKLAQLHDLDSDATTLLLSLEADSRLLIRDAVVSSYEAGGFTALQQLRRTLQPASTKFYGTRALDALVAETFSRVTGTNRGILRQTLNIYQTVVGTGAQVLLQSELRHATAEAAVGLLVGAETRLQTIQFALNRYAAKGITGFIDRSGRSWTLTAYTEMAMRTACARAQIQGHSDRFRSLGVDLIIVDDVPGECPLCRPWEGKVLSLSGDSSEYPSLDTAIGDGLFHPNCRHSINPYLPGITEPYSFEQTADPEGYEAEQHLRYLERKVREKKRLLAAAMTPEAEASARRSLNDYRAKIRQHVSTTGVTRQRWRESFGVSKKELANKLSSLAS